MIHLTITDSLTINTIESILRSKVIGKKKRVMVLLKTLLTPVDTEVAPMKKKEGVDIRATLVMVDLRRD